MKGQCVGGAARGLRVTDGDGAVKIAGDVIGVTAAQSIESEAVGRVLIERDRILTA